MVTRVEGVRSVFYLINFFVQYMVTGVEGVRSVPYLINFFVQCMITRVEGVRSVLYLSYFGVSVIHRTVTGTALSLKCLLSFSSLFKTGNVKTLQPNLMQNHSDGDS